jgi:putative spermidine/putrescine transport system substrate-binding protein
MSDLGRPVRRRSVLKGLGAGAAFIAAPAVFTRGAWGAETITVADNGGPFSTGFRKAYYDPFEKETGIKVISVVHEPDPSAQLRAVVDTKSYIWDAVVVTPGHIEALNVSGKSYLEPIGLSREEFPDIMPEALTENYLGLAVFATVMTYRTDKFGENGPKSWADFWDAKKFAGRRGFYRGSNHNLELALMADGVPIDKRYPMDIDRAFKMLDKIKPHIDVWWTSGAHNTQILQNGEVDLSTTWSGRAQAAIDAGTPLKIVWTDGLLGMDGWSIPRGTPRADLARKFVRFCADPKRMADWTGILAYGPTNLQAYQYIDKKRADLLPTHPDHVKQMRVQDSAWYAQNLGKLNEQFKSWMLK